MKNRSKLEIVGLFIAVIAVTVIVVVNLSSIINAKKVDVSNSAAEEFYITESTGDVVESEESIEMTEEQTSIESSTQSPSEIAATQEVKPEDLIGNGLSAEEWDYIYEQANKNAPNAVQPFNIIEFSNSGIKLYDANNDYYEWVPN